MTLAATIETADLRAAIIRAGRIAPSRPVIPIYAHALIHIADGTATITANNGDASIQIDIDATGDDMAFTADARALASWLANGLLDTRARISLDAETNRVTIKSGRARQTVASYPPLDFPTVSAPDAGAVIETAQLRAALAATLPAASTEGARYYLGGVHTACVGHEIIFTATDSHKLHRVRIPAPDGATDWSAQIIPREMIPPVLASLEKGPCEMSLTDTRWTVSQGRMRIVSKVIDGTFPDADRVIPARAAAPILAVSKGMIDGLRSIEAAFTGSKSRVTRFTVADGMMQIETPPDAVIESTASIDVEHDGPANWAANFQYVSAAIEACGTESVEISPPNGDGPIRIDAYGGETPVTCVVMPMRG